MRELEFVHGRDDVASVLRHAHSLGLNIRSDHPTDQPQSDNVNISTVGHLQSGVFVLYKDEWVYGEPQFGIIPSGHNAGRYSQQPATNYVSLVAYFSGERAAGSIIRLGSGFVSRNTNWLRTSDRTTHIADPDVYKTFVNLAKRIDTGTYLKGGVHNYLLLPHAREKLNSGAAIPPFDYIEWPPTVG